MNLKILTVSEFVDEINEVLSYEAVAVEGEVSEYSVKDGRLVFFRLSDEEASVECFSLLWRIRQPLEDGMKVRVVGVPGLYKKSGRFRINVEAVELVGEGALRRAFELLKAKLEKEGLFAPERKRTITRFPETIGLITSKDSEAYHDFLKVLKARWGGLAIFFLNVHVQGFQAIGEIVQAFEYFNGFPRPLNAIVLLRGGGSLEDLQAFNSEEVARAVFASKYPVVVGVGHERDETLADYIADLRASTPSNAAELLVPHRQAVENEVIALAGSMVRTVEPYVESLSSRVSHAVSALSVGLPNLDLRIRHAVRVILGMVAQLPQLFEHRLVLAARSIETLNPRATLARGYSIVRKGRKILRDVRDVQVDEEVDVTLHRGWFSSEVRKKYQ